MKVLITGATGFIGQRAALRLKAEGYDVVALVRKTSRAKALERARVRTVEGDITGRHRLEELFLGERPECVIHSAAMVLPSGREDMAGVNVLGTRNVCEACVSSGARRLVYISSVAVISGNSQSPLTDGLPYSSTNRYGRTKVEAEKTVLGYRQKGLASAVLRPCMVYGEDEPHALDRILEMVRKRRIPVSGVRDEREKLQLVHVDNVVHAIELAMARDEALEGTFIIADRDVITLSKFLRIAADELGARRPFVVPGFLVKAALVVPPLRRIHDRIYKDRLFDISRAVEKLGYNPPVSTEEGLRSTIRNWRRKRYF